KSFKDVYIFQGNSVPDGDLNGGTGKWDVLNPGTEQALSLMEKLTRFQTDLVWNFLLLKE
ncbi:MAG TPA: hypothetical protein VJ304_09280, partial [Flavobacterium sp.]|nr:hypothetical protein [Flavobacterium sp.]